MAATYSLTIAGTPKTIAQDWSLRETANGRNVLEAGVYSVDASYRPALDATVILAERVVILTSSVANPTTITTVEAHGIVDGQTIEIYNHSGSTPAISGAYTATRTGATTFTIPVNVTVGGTGGTAERRIFAGTITEPAEAGIGGIGRTPIETRFTAADYSSLAEHRYVDQTVAAGTLKAQITTLTANYLPTCTVHPSQVNGPAMLEMPVDFVLLRDVFNAMSTASGGYVWEIDPYLRVRFILPGSEAAPVSVTASNGVILGDLQVKPTRENYANRIILRFSERAHTAYGFFSLSAGNAADGQTVTLGKTYTFKTTLTDSDGFVKIGATNQDSIDNLVAAITLGGGAGSLYAASTSENTQATAYNFTSHTLKATALTPGAAGNSVSATTTCSNGSWFTEGGVGISTLVLGSDQELANLTIANNATEQTARGIWERVESAPNIIDLTSAVALAEDILAFAILTPQTVTYPTRALGIRPGQTQSIAVSERDVSGTFLITDVSTQSESDGAVRRTVTAVESTLLGAADRWQDTYKQWAGSSATGTVSASSWGGGGGGGGAPTGVFTILSADPAAPLEGTGWFVKSGTSLAVKARSGGITVPIAEITVP